MGKIATHAEVAKITGETTTIQNYFRCATRSDVYSMGGDLTGGSYTSNQLVQLQHVKKAIPSFEVTVVVKNMTRTSINPSIYLDDGGQYLGAGSVGPYSDSSQFCQMQCEYGTQYRGYFSIQPLENLNFQTQLAPSPNITLSSLSPSQEEYVYVTFKEDTYEYRLEFYLDAY